MNCALYFPGAFTKPMQRSRLHHINSDYDSAIVDPNGKVEMQSGLISHKNSGVITPPFSTPPFGSIFFAMNPVRYTPNPTMSVALLTAVGKVSSCVFTKKSSVMPCFK
jgi:hypothetical protein